MSENRPIRILFWNIKRSAVNVERILKYGRAEEIDIILLCETPFDFSTKDLFGYRKLEHYDINNKRGIEVFLRDKTKDPKTYYKEKKRYCLFRSVAEEISIIVAHLNSDRTPNAKKYRDADFYSLMEDIKSIETRYDENVLLVGDFNINLFDDKMFSILGLNARLFRYQMEKKVARVHEIERDLFYNPMLQIYKDSFDGSLPNGTYYKDTDIEWFCYDHVLMKYPLVKRFKNDSLQLVCMLEENYLVRDNKMVLGYSDHLPIRFEIEEV